jgi:hypothetical protein
MNGLVAFAVAASCASSSATKPGESRPDRSEGGSEIENPSSGLACGHFVAMFEKSSIDLAPPKEFVEVCEKEHEFCAELAAEYPPDVTTLGVFAPADNWAARQRGEHISMGRALIAQVTSSSDSEFPALKKFLRGRAGRFPDSSRLTEPLSDGGKLDLGVLDEGSDFISPGVIIKARRASLGLSPGPRVAINSVIAARGRIFSLYTFCAFSEQQDVDRCRRLTTEWLACLRGAARPGVEPDGPSVRGLTP